MSDTVQQAYIFVFAALLIAIVICGAIVAYEHWRDQ